MTDKMNSFRRLAVAALVLATAAVAVAQEKKKPADAAPAGGAASAMGQPAPAPETKKLAFLVGNFTSEERFFASPMMPQEMTSKGTYEGRFALGDFFVTAEVKSELMGGFTGRSFMKYDAEKKQYVLWWFDSMGTAQEYPGGQWKDEKTLVFECDIHHGGMPMRVRSAYTVTSPTTWTLKEEADYKDGKGFVPAMEIHFKKVAN